MSKTRIAWGITGAGDKILDIKNQFEELNEEDNLEIHIFVSESGKKVLEMYQIIDELKKSFEKFSIEENSNAPFLAGSLQTGVYDGLIIAPTTSNSIAKISNGIGDTLLTNSAIMAIKALKPVYVLPTDYETGTHKTELPTGETMEVRVREEDVKNVEKIKRMDDIWVLEEPEEIKDSVKQIKNKNE